MRGMRKRKSSLPVPKNHARGIRRINTKARSVETVAAPNAAVEISDWGSLNVRSPVVLDFFMSRYRCSATSIAASKPIIGPAMEKSSMRSES